jgi:hypothetical protein
LQQFQHERQLGGRTREQLADVVLLGQEQPILGTLLDRVCAAAALGGVGRRG